MNIPDVVGRKRKLQRFLIKMWVSPGAGVMPDISQ
jgi:hypothetical protein